MAAKGKKNNNAISNEEIIAALLQHGTIKAAADAAGVGIRTIYDRMNEREFRAEYAQAKADIVRQAMQVYPQIALVRADPKTHNATGGGCAANAAFDVR